MHAKINQQLLFEQMQSVMDELKSNSDEIKLINVTENEKNGYQSIFDVMLASKATFSKTIVFLQCVMDMLGQKIAEVWDLPDLLVKYNFHGLRATEHEQCKENEVLLYCNVCCKCPIYPSVGNGLIKTGRIQHKVRPYDEKKEERDKHWTCTKVVCYNHFTKDSEHWSNMKSGFSSGQSSWLLKCELAILHLIMLVVRMTKSYQADRQYPFNCTMLYRMKVIIGNIGHSIYYIKKLRAFISNEV